MHVYEKGDDGVWRLGQAVGGDPDVNFLNFLNFLIFFESLVKFKNNRKWLEMGVGVRKKCIWCIFGCWRLL